MKPIHLISAGLLSMVLLCVAALSLIVPERTANKREPENPAPSEMASRTSSRVAERHQSAWTRETGDARIRAGEDLASEEVASWADEMERRYRNPELTSVARRWDDLRKQTRAALQKYETTQHRYTLAATNGVPLTREEDEELGVRSEAQLAELNRLNRAATVAANQLNIFYLKYMKDTFDVRLN